VSSARGPLLIRSCGVAPDEAEVWASTTITGHHHHDPLHLDSLSIEIVFLLFDKSLSRFKSFG